MTHGGWRDWVSRHVGVDADQRFEIYRNVAGSVALHDPTYWIEILLSAGIATLGLALGSPAVIIGAMLISPLMGPILATGLALAAGDFVLAIRAISSVAISSVAAVAFSTLLVILLPFREMNAEIAARTQPNTLDLAIALFSGAVGALAMAKSRQGVGTSLPGVAIAVALMPPLCVTGYGVGVLVTLDRVQGLAVLRGGALLFVTNLVAIIFTSMLVFLSLHIDGGDVLSRVRSDPTLHDPAVLPRHFAGIGSLPARLLIVTVTLAALFVPLKRSFDALASEIRNRQQSNALHKEALAAWEEMFGQNKKGDPRSFIDRLDMTEQKDRLRVAVRVFTTQGLTEEERAAYVQRLAHTVKRPPASIDLSVIEIPTSQYKVAAGKADDLAASPAVTTPGQRLTAAAGDVRRALRATALPPGVTALDAGIMVAKDVLAVSVRYLADAPLSSDAESLIAQAVRERLDLPESEVRLEWVTRRTIIGPLVAAGGDLPGTAKDALSQVAGTLNRDKSLQVSVNASGDASLRHADAVVAYLQNLGIDPQRIKRGPSAGAGDRSVELVLTVGSSS